MINYDKNDKKKLMQCQQNHCFLISLIGCRHGKLIKNNKKIEKIRKIEWIRKIEE